MLQLLGSRTSRNPRNIRDQFAPLYRSLFRRKLSERPEDVDFLRIAFLDFISNQWDGRKADSRTLKRVCGQVSTQYVSRAELARSLGVDPRTVKRHADLKHLALEKNVESAARFDTSQFSFVSGKSGRLLNLREAAREIGISVAVLRSIKGSGEFEVRHQLHRQPGFHELDVRSFKNKVLALIPSEPSRTADLQAITVGESLRRTCQTTGEKTNLLREILTRRIPVVGQTERTFQGLLISSDDLCTFIKGQRKNEFGSVMTGKDAAGRLNCGSDAVRVLIEQKLLTARRTRRGWEIGEASVEEFNRVFVRLSCVAQPLGTSARRLMALCSRNNLEICEIKLQRGGAQPFVRRETVEKIMEYSESAAAKCLST
jgi:hypothetical protein